MRVDTFLTQSLPVTVQSLGRSEFGWRVAPAEPIAIDEDNSAQNALVINTGIAMGFGKERLKLR